MIAVKDLLKHFDIGDGIEFSFGDGFQNRTQRPL